VVNQYLGRSLLLGAIIFSSLLTVDRSNSQTLGKRYFCAVLNGTYKTFVSTDKGNIPIVNWVRSSSGWSVKQRCIAGSQRFQGFADRGMLKYISTGTVNYEPVLCAVAKKGDSCSNSNVLITLPRGSNSTETARQLLDIRALASDRVVTVSGGEKLESYVDDRYYFSVDSIEQIAEPATQELTPIEE
jgi:hypothetical protein